jgi:predicted MFS family arabinose efflux permease
VPGGDCDLRGHPRVSVPIRNLQCKNSGRVPGFVSLLQHNRNYRYAWASQVVSEIGDHFNNIAVFSLALATTRSGLVVSGVMLARAVSAVLAAPVAGVVLDRFDRRRVMIASDLVRAVIALGFIATIDEPRPWLLYTLSGLLMFASPFFSAGRASILPAITTADELHTANSLTQTTQWTTLTVGTVAAGLGAAMLGYEAAFMLNALSFLVSAWAIWKVTTGTRTKDEGQRTRDELRRGGHEGRRARGDDEPQDGIHEGQEGMLAGGSRRPWHDYVEGLHYMRGQPLVLAIALLGVGWASGGGAAQILFSLFGELVFERGPAGIGIIWGAAGFGLILGGLAAHRIGPRLSFTSYKRTIALCYLVHGGAYVMFSQAARFDEALFWIALSRAAVAVSSVLNWSLLLRLVAPEFRGRVFATNESLVWSTMMLSMLAAGIASQHVGPRAIGAVSGVLSSCTAIYWLWADRIGLLAEPRGANAREPRVRTVMEGPS